MLELDGKYIFGAAKVGEKGQIVIPKDARDTFGIKPGDSVMVVGDAKSGLALITDKTLAALFTGIFNGSIPTPPGTQGKTAPDAPVPPQGGAPMMPPQGTLPQSVSPQGGASPAPQGSAAQESGAMPQKTAPAVPPQAAADGKEKDVK